jgi:hypothetical protein
MDLVRLDVNVELGLQMYYLLSLHLLFCCNLKFVAMRTFNGLNFNLAHATPSEGILSCIATCISSWQ